VRLYISCWNVIVNADQQQNMPTEKQKKAGRLRLTVTLWCVCVSIVDVEKQYILQILSVCL
jgi:hypothetical protein